MDVLHHHLETVKATRLRDLDFSTEPLRQVLEYDSVGGREEREHVLDEVLLVLAELLPVLNVLAEIDLFSGPERCLLTFVHLPDVAVLDWE